ncbi:MAG: hypothetical protein J1E64_12080 [Acetatifactor sp.]|nr:hypothetical protein [Acetatifactor sp.]
MITDVFLKLVSMSLMASYCVLLICIVRFPMRRVPKTFSYLLWSIVAVRLLCPFTFESNFSLVGERLNTFAERVAAKEFPDASSQTDFWTEDESMNVSFTENEADLFIDQVSAGTQSDFFWLSVEQLWELLVQIIAYVWLFGMVLLLGYCAVSYLRLQYRLKRKTFYVYDYKKTPVFVVTGLDTPFVLGFLHPAIYLPADLTEQESGPCLVHEYTHICRKDHLIKLLAFVLVCVYWFQPLVWLAFYLMVEDMEMSCDEIALKDGNLVERKAYSNTMVRLASSSKHIFPGRFSGCPLAFGENNVSSRIKNILKLKKPTMWVLIVCGILLAVLAIGLLTDPVNTTPEPSTEVTLKDLAPASSVFVAMKAEDNNALEKMKAQLGMREDELAAELDAVQAKRDILHQKKLEESQKANESKQNVTVTVPDPTTLEASSQFIAMTEERLNTIKTSFRTMLTTYTETEDLNKVHTLATEISSQLSGLENDIRTEIDALQKESKRYRTVYATAMDETQLVAMIVAYEERTSELIGYLAHVIQFKVELDNALTYLVRIDNLGIMD